MTAHSELVRFFRTPRATEESLSEPPSRLHASLSETGNVPSLLASE